MLPIADSGSAGVMLLFVGIFLFVLMAYVIWLVVLAIIAGIASIVKK